MKNLELQLNKRLLIVEYETIEEFKIKYALIKAFKNARVHHFGYELIPICGGSELTEEIAFKFVEEKSRHQTNTAFKNYKGGNSFFFALESFISAIESKNMYWKDVPWDFPLVEDYGYQTSSSPEVEKGWMYEGGEEKYHEALKAYKEAESRTFNPEKTLIFEIV